MEEAMDLLRRSSRARQKAATALNYGSSRSHSIFCIALYGAADADVAAAASSTSDTGRQPHIILLHH